MASIDFPSNPANGDIYTADTREYVYIADSNQWKVQTPISTFSTLSALTQSIIPYADKDIDLGSAEKSFASLYLDGYKVVPFETKTLAQQGNLELTIGTARWYAPFDMKITSIIPRVRLAPQGQAINIRIKKNDSFMTTVSIPSGDNEGAENTGVWTVYSGDYITVDITQIGTTTFGADLDVQFKYMAR